MNIQKRFFLLVSALLICAAAACASGPAQPTEQLEISPTPPASTTTGPASLFLVSGRCAACHDNLIDSSGMNYSYFSLWSGSMHANAARDPYFLATVRAEIDHHQDLKAVIETTCATCHFPMARADTAAGGQPAAILDNGYYDPANPNHAEGIDGVSCSLCHQVTAEGLGQPTSFSGGYTIDLKTPPGERTLYGPFTLADQWQQVKHQATGYTAEQADHLNTPEFCASCHTLHTPMVDSTGKPSGQTFPEQMQYPEWQNSFYQGKMTCQSCHMPTLSTDQKISIVGGDNRPQINQHTFLGGNSFMMTVFKDSSEPLQVGTSAENLQAAAARTVEFLQSRVGQIEAAGSLENNTLTVKVKLNSSVGHKFPSGFPSRRAWIHLAVADSSGKVIFESGQWDENGRILQNDNDLDAAKFEPHYDLINSPEQVQIYEAVMGDGEGRVTTELIQANSYLKDNRLLPGGFNKEQAAAEIRVAGEAAQDATFTGGSDALTYQINTTGASGPFTVTVQWAFQTIGYRWAENVAAAESAEAQALRGYIQKTANQPVIVQEKKIEVQ